MPSAIPTNSLINLQIVMIVESDGYLSNHHLEVPLKLASERLQK